MNSLQKRRLAFAAGLVLIVIAAYAPAFRAGFIWDDDVHVLQNWNLRSLGGLWRIWFEPSTSPQYYPVAHTLFWVEYHLWGLWAAGDHAVNVLLHAANALMLWVILRRLRVCGAWIAALLFALHPVQVETVAWVMESKTLLATLFYFAALLALLQLWEAGETPRRRWGWYAAGVGLFALSLLSKSVTATLPAALLLILWWQRGKVTQRDIVLTLPLFVMGATAGLFTAWLERHHVGAEGAEWALTPIDRVLIAGRALWFYADKLLWPRPLIFFYPRWEISDRVWWQYLFPIGALGVMAGLWAMRRQMGRGPLAAVLFFAGTLAPALGFLNFYPMRYSFVADHFQYLACAGLFALAGAVSWRVAREPRTRLLAPAAIGIVACALGTATFFRTFAYRDSLTLYTDIVRKNPGSWGGHALLAATYQAKGDYAPAVAQWKEAVRLNPKVLQNQEGLGASLLGEGKVDEARAVLEKVLAEDPSRGEIYNDLAGVYLRLNERGKAASFYEQAIARNPHLSQAYYNLGTLLADAGEFAGAERALKEALRQRPEWPEAALKLGECLASEGKLREAYGYFRTAVEMRPAWPEAQQNWQRINQVLPRGSR